MLTPVDIHRKNFRRSMRGYDVDEVNGFLDDIIETMAGIMDENEHLREALTREKKNNEEFRKLEDNVRNTLAIAQKTANETLARAKSHANQIISAAEKESNNIRREAELSVQGDVDEAKMKLKLIVTEYERIVQEKNKFLKRMKIALETELKLIEDDMDAMPDAKLAAEPAAKPVKMGVEEDTVDLGSPIKPSALEEKPVSSPAFMNQPLFRDLSENKPLSRGLPTDMTWGN